VNQSGGYVASVVSVSSPASINQIWGNLDGGPGALLRQEGVIGPLTQGSFEAQFGISADTVAYAAFVDEQGGSMFLDSIWLDDTVVATNESLGPGTSEFFSLISRAGVTQAGIPYFVGSSPNTQGGSSQRRWLFFGSTPTAIIQTGEVLPNLPAALTTSAIDFDFRFSSLGTHHITAADLDTAARRTTERW